MIEGGNFSYSKKYRALDDYMRVNYSSLPPRSPATQHIAIMNTLIKQINKIIRDHSPILTIQRVYRGHRIRRQVDELREYLNYNATMIQKVWRGFQGRKVAGYLKLRTNAAKTVQRAFRRFYQRNKRIRDAATRIQTVWRMMIIRRTEAEERFQQQGGAILLFEKDVALVRHFISIAHKVARERLTEDSLKRTDIKLLRPVQEFPSYLWTNSNSLNGLIAQKQASLFFPHTYRRLRRLRVTLPENHRKAVMSNQIPISRPRVYIKPVALQSWTNGLKDNLKTNHIPIADTNMYLYQWVCAKKGVPSRVLSYIALYNKGYLGNQYIDPKIEHDNRIIVLKKEHIQESMAALVLQSAWRAKVDLMRFGPSSFVNSVRTRAIVRLQRWWRCSTSHSYLELLGRLKGILNQMCDLELIIEEPTWNFLKMLSQQRTPTKRYTFARETQVKFVIHPLTKRVELHPSVISWFPHYLARPFYTYRGRLATITPADVFQLLTDGVEVYSRALSTVDIESNADPNNPPLQPAQNRRMSLVRNFMFFKHDKKYGSYVKLPPIHADEAQNSQVGVNSPQSKAREKLSNSLIMATMSQGPNEIVIRFPDRREAKLRRMLLAALTFSIRPYIPGATVVPANAIRPPFSFVTLQMSRNQMELDAAIRIQAAWRGCVARSRVRRMKLGVPGHVLGQLKAVHDLENRVEELYRDSMRASSVSPNKKRRPRSAGEPIRSESDVAAVTSMRAKTSLGFNKESRMSSSLSLLDDSGTQELLLESTASSNKSLQPRSESPGWKPDAAPVAPGRPSTSPTSSTQTPLNQSLASEKHAEVYITPEEAAIRALKEAETKPHPKFTLDRLKRRMIEIEDQVATEGILPQPHSYVAADRSGLERRLMKLALLNDYMQEQSDNLAISSLPPAIAAEVPDNEEIMLKREVALVLRERLFEIQEEIKARIREDEEEKAEIGRQHLRESAAARNRVIAIAQSMRDTKLLRNTSKMSAPQPVDREAEVREKASKVAQLREEQKQAREALMQFFEVTRAEVISQSRIDKMNVQDAMEYRNIQDQKRVQEVQTAKSFSKSARDRRVGDIGFSKSFSTQQNMISRHLRMSEYASKLEYDRNKQSQATQQIKVKEQKKRQQFDALLEEALEKRKQEAAQLNRLLQQKHDEQAERRLREYNDILRMKEERLRRKTHYATVGTSQFEFKQLEGFVTPRQTRVRSAESAGYSMYPSLDLHRVSHPEPSENATDASRPGSADRHTDSHPSGVFTLVDHHRGRLADESGQVYEIHEGYDDTSRTDLISNLSSHLANADGMSHGMFGHSNESVTHVKLVRIDDGFPPPPPSKKLLPPKPVATLVRKPKTAPSSLMDGVGRESLSFTPGPAQIPPRTQLNPDAGKSKGPIAPKPVDPLTQADIQPSHSETKEWKERKTKKGKRKSSIAERPIGIIMDAPLPQPNRPESRLQTASPIAYIQEKSNSPIQKSKAEPNLTLVKDGPLASLFEG
eukprot:TRINITY_DN8897_c0_g1_i1.p1 TRINITY_DN8897_c0_g1~~TRINITY_DN8897_c0_g1_i1.p1  ORF type:complete len:1555 (+),score=282.02 TRINITY_DN8897_c0_g1_i1:204-4667(+)